MRSRHGSLKQIDSVGPVGETVLDYSAYDALRAGFSRAVFVIRQDFEEVFRVKVAYRVAARVEVGYVGQGLHQLPAGRTPPPARTKPWGTGHAVWCAAAQIAEPFALINGDDSYGADSFRQLWRFLSGVDSGARPVPCCMVGFKLANTLSDFGAVSRGVCAVDAGGRLQDVEECVAIERSPYGDRQENPDGSLRSFTGDEIVSMNCGGLSSAIFTGLERQWQTFLDEWGADLKAEFYLPAALAGLIALHEATVAVLPTGNTWFGITYREDHPRVVAALQTLARAGIYPERLWKD
jgi:hypothetical protein